MTLRRRSLISLLTLIIGFAFCSDFSFDFTPTFLYVYEAVELDTYYNFPIVKFSIPSFPMAEGSNAEKNRRSRILKNSPPQFLGGTGSDFNIFKYFFSFSFAKNVYDYIDFGRITGTYSPTNRTSYRGYNKGRFINNSFQWYACYEKYNYPNITEDDGVNRAEHQLNKSGYTYYWLVF